MRKIAASLGLVAFAGVVCAQGSGGALIADYAKALNSAKSLKVQYTYQLVGGAPSNYTIEFSKPNKARIDTPSVLVVADGSKITTLTKSNNQYYKKNQTPNDFKSLLMSEEIVLWSGFFFPEVIEKAPTPKTNGTKNRKGMTLAVVQFSTKETPPRDYTLYLNKEDGVLRQAEISGVVGASKQSYILDAKSVELGASIDASEFAFAAPAGSKELTEEEMFGAKWYTDINQALAVAKATGKIILIDFWADWCHWCHELDRTVFNTEAFKAMSKYFVFCKIDTENDAQIGPVKSLGILSKDPEGLPTTLFVNGSGKVVHEFVGYKPIDEYLKELDKARSSR